MSGMNVNPTEVTSAHPEPTPFLSQSHEWRRSAARVSLASEASALPEYETFARADAEEQNAWTRWTEARASSEAADGDLSLQAALERCSSAWAHFIDAEARRSAASVEWRRAYRALPAFDELLMATALSSLNAPSSDRLAA